MGKPFIELDDVVFPHLRVYPFDSGRIVILCPKQAIETTRGIFFRCRR